MSRAGYAPFRKYQTWYQVKGDLHGGTRPLVILHGGPAATHAYMTALDDLAVQFDIPVVQYDQLGCGKSTWLPEEGPDFWTFDLFLDELNSLLRHLKINEYNLLGHSWGGMLASEHAVRRPAGLRRLILASAPADVPLTMKETDRLLTELPQDVQDTIKKHEDEGTTDSPEYQAAAQVFFAKHVCRLSEVPAAMEETVAALAANPHVYNILQGPSEFKVTGKIKTWSIVDRLPSIQTPTLIINGKYDEITDANARLQITNIPGARWVQFAESSHMLFWEEREKCMEEIAAFLRAPASS